jgi:hypothetical protein
MEPPLGDGHPAPFRHRLVEIDAPHPHL